MNATVPKSYELSSGYKIPSLGLGTYEIPPNKTAEVVYQALKVGYRHFDTAVLYGNEYEVGQGIKRWIDENPQAHKREDVFYTTKIWDTQNGYEKAKKAIDHCLEEVEDLRYIDLLLIHSPLSGKKLRLETYQAMQEAVDEGKVKSIGVSNFGFHHIEELLKWDKLKYKPVVNQIEISPWCMRQELADYCQSMGIRIEAYAPLTHGYKLKDPDLIKVANEVGCDAGQALIRWSLQKGYIPLPKTQSVSRLASNLDVYSFDLTSDQMDQLDQPFSYEPTDWECTNAP
ncbi:unnamed protein product [Kluyveromyces dobzhanskii CBS 2104]|uniref:WGS project CCBQ000000000 data, contig 00015 n=1 Tax=Kluyveromyces dobzhanskii CBS 2104 TaxID=1427455 RepID=A0A0A8LBI8_9SACH|nr:unnamed protein product [Kluyveromyces dobzhanskii CBS 2104]